MKKSLSFAACLFAVCLGICTAAVASPSFAGGSIQTLTACNTGVPISINSLLTVTDPVPGTTEIWSTFSTPSHGSVVASYIMVSTEGELIPYGLTYTPDTAYIGTDTFAVQVSNGTASVTTVICVTVTAAIAPCPISGSTSFCSGTPVVFSDSLPGGTWSSSNNLVVTIDAGSGIAEGVATGVASISYSISTACGIISAGYNVSVTSTGTWLGTVNDAWSNSSNWACGIIPSSSQDAIIPGASMYINAPVLDISSACAKNLTIYATGFLSLGDNQLNLSGNMHNDGVVAGSGLINLNGSSAQMLSGNGTVSNLTLANAAGAYINDTTDTVGITGTLLLNSGTLNTNGTLVLISDSTGNGTIGAITNGHISGKVIMEQYIPAGRRAYRFIAHPFTDSISLSQLEHYIDITGAGGAANGFTPTITNVSSAYWYNPLYGNSSLANDPGWRSFTNTFGLSDSNMLHRYQGMRLFVRGAKGEGLTNVPYVIDAAAYRVYGTVNTGAQVIPMVKGTGTDADWNFLGNPYPAFTDIGSVIDSAYTAGLLTGAAFYVWDPYRGISGQYVPMPVDGGQFFIAPNEVFCVRTAANGNALNFSENNKGANANLALMKNNEEKYIKLTVYDESNHPWDMFYIRFNNTSTDNEDDKYDGLKLPCPSALNFYTISADKKKLSLDTRPFSAGKAIPIGISSSYVREFIIQADEAYIPSGQEVYLHDKYLGTWTLLQAGKKYRFSITTDSLSQGNDRFELFMGSSGAVSLAPTTQRQITIVPNPAADEVNISYLKSGNDNANFQLLNMAGVCVLKQDLGTQENINTNINLEQLIPGMYIAELTYGNEKITSEIIKK